MDLSVFQQFALSMSLLLLGFVALVVVFQAACLLLRLTITVIGYAAMPLAYVMEHAYRRLRPRNRTRLTWTRARRRYRRDLWRLTDPLDRAIELWA